MMDTKKAPREAATSQGANEINSLQKHTTTKSGELQGFLLSITSLEAAEQGIILAESLCGLLAQGMGEETGGAMLPHRVEMYSNGLCILENHLRTLKDSVNSDIKRLYQEKRCHS